MPGRRTWPRSAEPSAYHLTGWEMAAVVLVALPVVVFLAVGVAAFVLRRVF